MGNTKPPDLVGQRIGGRFLVERLLGRGGMGEVYLGRHELLNLRVAIKLLKPQHAKDARMAARFRREARATARVQHPNVVAIYDTGQLEDGRLFLIMEYVQGRSLIEIYEEEGPLPMARALPVFLQMADALATAHAMGILHRDLKPDNVVLVPPAAEGGRETVKILDFGLAKMLDDESAESLTLPGEVFGTPQYMSPEQCMGEPLTLAADVWSFGALAYEALTGDPPFMASSLLEFVLAQRNRKVPPASENAPHGDVPPEIDRIIADCLQPEPAARIPDGRVLRERLQEAAAALAHRAAGSPPGMFRRTPTSQWMAADDRTTREEVHCMMHERLWDQLLRVVQLLRQQGRFPVGLGPKMAQAGTLADEIAALRNADERLAQAARAQEEQYHERLGRLRQAIYDLSYDRELIEKFLARHPDATVMELVTAFPGLGVYTQCASIREVLDETVYQITELERRFAAVQEEWENTRRENAATIAKNTSLRRDLEREKTTIATSIIEALIGPEGRHLRDIPQLAAEIETLSLYYQETLPILDEPPA